MMLKQTLYYNYVKDRLGAEILEDDTGFIVYTINNGECFIHEMSVREIVRAQGYGKTLISDLEKIAKENNCHDITANIHLWDKNSSNTLIAALKTGFQVGKANNDVLLIFKNLLGGS